MTFSETNTPSTAPEAASQYSADDPCGLDDIPSFLRRTPGKTARRRQPPRQVWHVTPAMKIAAQKDQERREKIAARPVVLRAIEDGAETFGQVRKATDLSDPWIQAALRFHVKAHAILKTGKRYHATAQRRRRS